MTRLAKRFARLLLWASERLLRVSLGVMGVRYRLQDASDRIKVWAAIRGAR